MRRVIAPLIAAHASPTRKYSIQISGQFPDAARPARRQRRRTIRLTVMISCGQLAKRRQIERQHVQTIQIFTEYAFFLQISSTSILRAANHRTSICTPGRFNLTEGAIIGETVISALIRGVISHLFHPQKHRNHPSAQRTFFLPSMTKTVHSSTASSGIDAQFSARHLSLLGMPDDRHRRKADLSFRCRNTCNPAAALSIASFRACSTTCFISG